MPGADFYSQLTVIESSYSRGDALCHVWIEGYPSPDYTVDCEKMMLSPSSCFYAYPPEGQLWDVELACAQR